MPVEADTLVEFDPDFPVETTKAFESRIKEASDHFARVRANQLGVDEAPAPVSKNGSIQGPLDFAYGLPPSCHQPLADACNSFKWDEWIKPIKNMGIHYQTLISGNDQFEGNINLHFVCRKSKKQQGEPERRKVILLIHGWPGYFGEFLKVAELLDDMGYDSVIPSIPGYTFSSEPRYKSKPEGSPWTQTATAQCFHALMQKLGYKEYFAQGGDWGSLITRRIAQLYPENCRAIHLNYFMITDSQLPSGEQMSKASERDQYGMQRRLEFAQRGSAYAQMQGTTPYTLGAALSAHPIALLTYLSEKLLRWCHPNSRLSLDEIIGITAMYYLNNRVTSSFWLYYNRIIPSGDNALCATTKVTVPTALTTGQEEIYWTPRAAAESALNIVSWSQFEKGGHFVAAEEPATFTKAIVDFFNQQ